MIKNYFKTAFRFLRENRVFAGINVLGLSIALSASFIILLYVINELSYDHFNRNRKNIYKVLNYYKDFNQTMSGTPYILASALKEQFPQVGKATRLKRIRGMKLKLKDEYIDVTGAISTDSEIFDIFTLPLLMGPGTHNILDDMNSIVLSGDYADKFFPGTDPVGKEIQGIMDGKTVIFVVRGVYKNIPANSTIRATCLVNSKWSLDPINKIFNVSDAEKNWTFDFWDTYILLSKNNTPDSLEARFRAFEIKNISADPHNHYSLQKLSDVYLGSANVANAGITGDVSNIKLFSSIALLIILVAAFNYIILSTAVSSGRAKEIGIRKTFGAAGKNIKYQLYFESILLAIIVLPIALVLTRIALPYAGILFDTKLQIIKSNILTYLLVYLLLTVIIGIASGMYTSAYLSRLKVMDVIKNVTQTGKNKLILRSVLIVVQLVIFCTCVASTLIIHSQYKYALNKNPGYYNKDIISIDLGRDFKGYSSYINNIKSNPNIISAAGVMEGLPMNGSMSFMFPNFENKELKIRIEGLDVDFNYLKTMGLMLKEGRDFSEEFGGDMTSSCILNESAVKQLSLKDPVGKKLGSYNIIGIIKDFNLHSIRTDIPPLQINLTDKFINQVAVHYKPGTLNTILPLLETEWKKVAPDRQFSYSTIESLIKDLYSSERNLTVIVSIFAFLTLIIATFGLFGLTLFVSKSRTKEIGIKKVFGSSEQSIVYSFLRGNLNLALLASVIATPVTLYFMLRWLKNFSYKISIDWVFFIEAFILSAVVVLLTVLFHSVKASRINPVDALRYE